MAINQATDRSEISLDIAAEANPSAGTNENAIDPQSQEDCWYEKNSFISEIATWYEWRNWQMVAKVGR